MARRNQDNSRWPRHALWARAAVRQAWKGARADVKQLLARCDVGIYLHVDALKQEQNPGRCTVCDQPMKARRRDQFLCNGSSRSNHPCRREYQRALNRDESRWQNAVYWILLGTIPLILALDYRPSSR